MSSRSARTSVQPDDPGPATAGLDLALRLVGGLVATAGAVVTGVLELLLSAIRVGGELIGVSVVLAALANAALGWFTHYVTGRLWAVGLPAVAWFGLMLVAAQPTREGDLLIRGDDWVGFVMILAGSLAFAVVVFRQLTKYGPGGMR